MTTRSVPQLTIMCATALVALVVAITAFHAMPAVTVMWLAGAAVAGVFLMFAGTVVLADRGLLGPAGKTELGAGSPQDYHRLAEEYRRLSDLAITSQEHTDLKLSDVSAQLDHLRGQVDSLQRILRDVE